MSEGAALVVVGLNVPDVVGGAVSSKRFDGAAAYLADSSAVAERR